MTAAPIAVSVRGRPIEGGSLPHRDPGPMETRFTSTGSKFWLHREAMESYKAGTGRSVISTHVSPEGRCNLTCDYCSVKERKLHARIELPRIQAYLTALQGRGLKAVILTGGGEPTLYPDFNALGEWALDAGLELALISNGTQFKRVSDRIMRGLSWLRVSMNKFKDWSKKVEIPMDRVGPQTTVGLSVCYFGDNKDPAFLTEVGHKAHDADVKYVRVLPNCMLPQALLLKEHDELDVLFAGMTGGSRFFHQFKVHGAPGCAKCHQSHFRPYLSEAIDPVTGRPGLVFPCDSVVLNDESNRFRPKWALCAPEEVLDYLDGKIPQPFDAREACSGCVFTRSVDMLDRYVAGGEEHFDAAADAPHANFV